MNVSILLNSSRVSCFVLCVLAFFVVELSSGQSDFKPPSKITSKEFEKIPESQSKSRKLYAEVTKGEGKKMALFTAYLEKKCPVGKTTLQAMIDILGSPIDLDRPASDNVTTMQWYLSGDYSSGLILYADFAIPKDEKSTPKLMELQLSSFSFGRSICGFCPHIFILDGKGEERLEGKLLAGCVGAENAGSDILILPRLENSETHSVVFSNLAPEIEYIHDVALAKVPLKAEEQLDVANNGELVVWTPRREVNFTFGDSIPIKPEDELLVLELRNTFEFETILREHFLLDQPAPVSPNLLVSYSNQMSLEIEPVGTKFLRRIAMKVPVGSSSVRASSSNSFWEVRRVWAGDLPTAQPAIEWIQPQNPGSIELHPHEFYQYQFQTGNIDSKSAYAIRASGYYEFVLPY